MAEGYDTSRFQSTIDEALTCFICLGVLKDPLQCAKNEHYFCSGCIKKHLKNNSHTCPVCHDMLTVETTKKPSRPIENMLSRLQIKCDHAATGCRTVLALGALDKHVQDCDFMPVACSNEGCGHVAIKRCIAKHEKESCLFKTITCNDCGKNMPHHKYGTHGCLLRRDVEEIKDNLADVQAMQEELSQKMQEIIAVINNLDSMVQNLALSQSAYTGNQPVYSLNISNRCIEPPTLDNGSKSRPRFIIVSGIEDKLNALG